MIYCQHTKKEYILNKNDKIEVTKIVIKIGSKDAELTIEQARDLKDALVELLGSKDKEIVYIPQPYPVYHRPYWYVTYGDVSKPWNGTVTYSLNR